MLIAANCSEKRAPEGAQVGVVFPFCWSPKRSPNKGPCGVLLDDGFQTGDVCFERRQFLRGEFLLQHASRQLLLDALGESDGGLLDLGGLGGLGGFGLDIHFSFLGDTALLQYGNIIKTARKEH